MKIILLQDIKTVGKGGELKEVKDGYARNFLIAKGLAKPATSLNLAQYEQGQAKRAADEQKLIAELGKHQQLINSLIFEQLLKTDKTGKGVFDSVNKQSIKEFLATQSIEISPEQIELDKPIKDIGSHTVLISLGKGIEATLKIQITHSS